MVRALGFGAARVGGAVPTGGASGHGMAPGGGIVLGRSWRGRVGHVLIPGRSGPESEAPTEKFFGMFGWVLPTDGRRDQE